MTSVHTGANHAFNRPMRPYAPAPRKNSAMSAANTPILSSFAIDLIAQFDNYRVNMRESLQREVEENIHKAKVLKEAMKESSDRDAEYMISAEQQEYQNGSSTPNNRSNTSLNKQSAQGQANGLGESGFNSPSGKAGSTNGDKEKRSRLDRFFGRKASVNSNAGSSIRNHQVTPLSQPSPLQPPSRPNSFPQTPSPSLRASNTLTAHANGSGVEGEIRYLPVDEESDHEDVRDRAMGVSGAGVGGSGVDASGTGTEVKLHPTRAKTFALPKSLRNLKRRIAALRAKGTDLDVEKREREERERGANGGAQGVPEDKKKFAFIRLLPWKIAKKTDEA